MMKYKIEFFSNWQCGSGQAKGADVDALAIVGRDGLPYIPGRTIKGLLSDACCLLCQYGGLDKKEVTDVFGHFDNKDEFSKGSAFFSNATLPDAKAIASSGLAPWLFQSVSSTAIDDDGIAKDYSLRKVQTVVPCTLVGEISGVPDSFKGSMEKAMKLVKRLGVGRNHGLGRCRISTIKEE